MQTIYRAILWLYPPECKATFGREMLETFQLAQADSKRGGTLRFALFTLRELSGLLRGLFSQRIAKAIAQDAYVTPRSAVCQHPSVPADIGNTQDEIADLQRHVDFLIRSMEYAIAHHDFPKARFYSVEERVARVRLQTLLNNPITQ